MKCIYFLSILPLIIGTFVACLKPTETVAKNEPKYCECALYGTRHTNKVVEKYIPIIQRSFIEVNCTAGDELKCKILCIDLVKTAALKGPQIVCNAIGNAENLIVYLYSKVCRYGWQYTDRASTNKLCCKNSLPVPCAGQKEVPRVLTNTNFIHP